MPSSAAGDDTDEDAAGDDDKNAGNGAGGASVPRSRAATAGIASGLGEDDADAALQEGSELESELREAMAAAGGDFDFDDAVSCAYPFLVTLLRLSFPTDKKSAPSPC